MPVYASSKQLYLCLEQLFFRLQEEDAQAAAALAAVRLVIELQTRDPDGVIVLDGRGSGVHASFGRNSRRPDLTIWLPADLLHEILLGRTGLRQAMAQRRLQVQGPVLKAMRLAPLFHHSQRLYPQILRQQGIA